MRENKSKATRVVKLFSNIHNANVPTVQRPSAIVPIRFVMLCNVAPVAIKSFSIQSAGFHSCTRPRENFRFKLPCAIVFLLDINRGVTFHYSQAVLFARRDCLGDACSTNPVLSIPSAVAPQSSSCSLGKC